jgi:sRNA-binding protein
MPSIRTFERNRGLKESREQIKLLQDKWPAAFPKQGSLVRPLANGVPKTIGETAIATLKTLANTLKER